MDRRRLNDPRPWKPWLHVDQSKVKHPKTVDVDSVLAFRTVKEWTDRKSGNGRMPALYHMAAYLKWREAKGLSTDPDLWVDECRNGTNRTLIEHLEPLKQCSEGEMFDGDEFSTRRKFYTDIRSFYYKHLVPLPQSRLDAVKKAVKVQAQVTAVEFLQMAQKVLATEMRPRDRSIMLSMIQGGMDASTLAEAFNYVAFPQLAKHFGTPDWNRWDEKKVPVRIDLVRPKTNYQFYTFQDTDAIVALRDYLNVRNSLFGPLVMRPSNNPQIRDTSDPVYITEYREPIDPEYVSRIFYEYGVKAGVNVVPEERLPAYKGASRRYPFHSHEVRDTLVTLARRAKVELPVANYFVGHSIDKYKYDKSPWDDPEHFKEQYMLLAPYLNIISQKETLVREKIERSIGGRMRVIEEENRELRAKVLQADDDRKRLADLYAELKHRGVI
jgi:hypothetical protein